MWPPLTCPSWVSSLWFNVSFTHCFCYCPIKIMETKLTVTVEELESIMDPIVGLFPRRFLWKLNQTEPVRASKPAPPGTFTACPQGPLDIFRLFTSLGMWSNLSHFVSIYQIPPQKQVLFLTPKLFFVPLD